MIERWLREHLERTGRWNSDRVSRQAATAYCRGCGATLLVGLDAERCALPATVDLAPLSRQGEMIARLLDLRTYSLRWALDSLVLDQRNQWSIELAPAGTKPYDVVAEHQCGVTLPRLDTAHFSHRVADYSGDPPF